MDTNLSKLREIAEDRGAWHAAVYEAAKSQTQLNDWTTNSETPNCMGVCYFFYWDSEDREQRQ